MKKIVAIVLALVLVMTASASAEVSVCHHGDGKNCVAERNTVGSVALEAPANLYASVDEVKAAGFNALLSTTGLFNAVYNGSGAIVERYQLVLDANAVVPVKGGKLAIENGAEEVEGVKAPTDFGTTFAVVRCADGRYYGAIVVCCCGGNGGNGGDNKGEHPEVRPTDTKVGEHPKVRPTDPVAPSNQGNEGPETVPVETTGTDNTNSLKVETDAGEVVVSFNTTPVVNEETTGTDNTNSLKVETDAGEVVVSFNTTPVASEEGEHSERPAANTATEGEHGSRPVAQ